MEAFQMEADTNLELPTSSSRIFHQLPETPPKETNDAEKFFFGSVEGMKLKLPSQSNDQLEEDIEEQNNEKQTLDVAELEDLLTPSSPIENEFEIAENLTLGQVSEDEDFPAILNTKVSPPKIAEIKSPKVGTRVLRKRARTPANLPDPEEKQPKKSKNEGSKPKPQQKVKFNVPKKSLVKQPSKPAVKKVLSPTRISKSKPPKTPKSSVKPRPSAPKKTKVKKSPVMSKKRPLHRERSQAPPPKRSRTQK